MEDAASRICHGNRTSPRDERHLAGIHASSHLLTSHQIVRRQLPTKRLLLWVFLKNSILKPSISFFFFNFHFSGYVGLRDRAAYCGVSADHTGCLFRSVGTKTCNHIVGRKVSDTEKKLIVDLHNEKRRRVANGSETKGFGSGQPVATNMIELVNHHN